MKAKELKLEEMNYQAWLTGLYVNNAVAVVIGNAFGKAKNKYIEKPIPLTEEAVARSERQKEEMWKAQFQAYTESLKGKLPCN